MVLRAICIGPTSLSPSQQRVHWRARRDSNSRPPDDCAAAPRSGPVNQRMTDFFISYTSTDKAWAEWIAYVVEEEGYTVVIQA
jgi:hypothetical protein